VFNGLTCLACSTRASWEAEMQLLPVLLTTVVAAVPSDADSRCDDVSSTVVDVAHVVITEQVTLPPADDILRQAQDVTRTNHDHTAT